MTTLKRPFESSAELFDWFKVNPHASLSTLTHLLTVKLAVARHDGFVS